MSNLSDAILMKSLRRQPVERTPVWIMRQAGRYLPEYRETRAKAGSFLALCKNPELACEVTLQPLRRFALDAAILFSDILTIPDAMGLGLSFTEGEGPCFANPIRTLNDIETLRIPDVPEDLAYVMEAASLIRQNMPSVLPLIGFSGSPWTLACYMVEGGGSRDFKHALTLLYRHPQAMHQLLLKITQVVITYLTEQVRAGVNVLMIFDTWGGILSTPRFKAFSCDYLSMIVNALKQAHPDIPIILFTKGGGLWLRSLANTGCDALGIDWTCDLSYAREQVGADVALQGNLDPAVLRASPDVIRQEVRKVMQSYGSGTGHIFNLGHGITPDIPPEHVAVLVDAVREFSMHQGEF
jgi:uroporphyrinogen decarboxylase